MENKVLVITPVSHINGVKDILESFSEVTYLEEATYQEVKKEIANFDAVFTNPNKSEVFLDQTIIDKGINLKCICTASTGTNHIDKEYALEKGLPIISLTEERDIINKIGSTAELAFALTMASLRNLVSSHTGALKGQWDYTEFIGRQMDGITVGVVGYGRLGKFYAHFCKSFGSKVLIYDPYVKVSEKDLLQVNDLKELVKVCDVISIHVHVTPETVQLISSEILSVANKDIIIVNTSRGEVVDENAVVSFLKNNQKAKLATDVLNDEIRSKSLSPILDYAKESDQVLVTQHIGGMTREAQEIAYGHAANLLKDFFVK